MSKTHIDLTDTVMQQIREKRVVMKPKIYFVGGSLLAIIGLISSGVVSLFLISLTRFALKSHGPMGQVRLDLLLSSFPWWAPSIAVFSMALGVIFLRKYDFSYKRNFGLVVIVFITAIIIAAFAIDVLGLDAVWFRQGPMRGIMRQYIQNTEDSSMPSSGVQRKYLQRKQVTP